MRIFGWIVLTTACILGIYAMGMDTSVDTGGAFGRINNIGLMNDRQNLILLSCAGFVGGLMMLIFDTYSDQPASSHPPSSHSGDPFDEIDAETENERKRYAIRLGIKRVDGTYHYNDVIFKDLESAILAAEVVRQPPDPAEHFLG